MNLEQYLTENPAQRRYADLLVYPPDADEIREEFPDADGDVLDRCMQGINDGGFVLSRGAMYVISRRNGQSDREACIVALQRAPIGQTNDTFWGGRKHFSEVFGENYANAVRAGLARKGINLTAGQEYMPELVRPNMGFGPHNPDPEAVVPFGGGRSYIKSVLEKRGWAGEIGGSEVQHREPESDPWDNRVPVAEDIVQREIKRMVKEDPGLKKKKRAELREQVIARHGPSS